MLNEATALYKVDTDAIAAKVKQEFAAKDKAKTAKKDAAETASQTTGKDSEEVRSSLTLNPTESLARGLQPQAPRLFVCLPVYSPSCVAHDIRQERHH